MLTTALQRIMSRPPITVGPETSLAEAAELMLDESVGSLLVVDPEGRLVGILTDGDFTARLAGVPFSTLRRPQVLGEWLGEEGVERIYEEARQRKVADVMTRYVHCVTSADDLERVLRLMMEYNVKHVPVVDDERPIGMVARHDVLKMMLGTMYGAGVDARGTES